MLSARFSNTRETDRRYRVSLEHRIIPNLLVGVDYVPRTGDLFPRAVMTTGRLDRAQFIFGTSSRRTATEGGGQGVFALIGRRFGSVTLFGGAFQPFDDRLQAAATAALALGSGFSFEPGYDGQFIHLTLAKQLGNHRVAVSRSGTGRFGVAFVVGF